MYIQNLILAINTYKHIRYSKIGKDKCQLHALSFQLVFNFWKIYHQYKTTNFENALQGIVVNTNYYFLYIDVYIFTAQSKTSKLSTHWVQFKMNECTYDKCSYFLLPKQVGKYCRSVRSVARKKEKNFTKQK